MRIMFNVPHFRLQINVLTAATVNASILDTSEKKNQIAVHGVYG